MADTLERAPKTAGAQYIGIQAASKRTGIPTSTLRGYVARGRLTAYRTPSRKLWFLPDDLDQLFTKVTPTQKD
jgi:predicted site-specific integrase-resolvase